MTMFISILAAVACLLLSILLLIPFLLLCDYIAGKFSAKYPKAYKAAGICINAGFVVVIVLVFAVAIYDMAMEISKYL